MTPTPLRPHFPRPLAIGPAWPSFAPVGVATAAAAVIMVMMMGLMPTAVAVAAENVAPNPGFEYGANGRPTFSGDRFDGRAVAWVADPQAAHSGRYAVRLRAGVGADAGVMPTAEWASEPVAIVGERRHVIAVYLRPTALPATAAVTISVTAIDEARRIVGTHSVAVPADALEMGEWREIRTEWGPPAVAVGMSATITLAVGEAEAGRVAELWVDDWRLVPEMVPERIEPRRPRRIVIESITVADPTGGDDSLPRGSADGKAAKAVGQIHALLRVRCAATQATTNDGLDVGAWAIAPGQTVAPHHEIAGYFNPSDALEIEIYDVDGSTVGRGSGNLGDGADRHDVFLRGWIAGLGTAEACRHHEFVGEGARVMVRVDDLAPFEPGFAHNPILAASPAIASPDVEYDNGSAVAVLLAKPTAEAFRVDFFTVYADEDHPAIDAIYDRIRRSTGEYGWWRIDDIENIRVIYDATGFRRVRVKSGRHERYYTLAPDESRHEIFERSDAHIVAARPVVYSVTWNHLHGSRPSADVAYRADRREFRVPVWVADGIDTAYFRMPATRGTWINGDFSQRNIKAREPLDWRLSGRAEHHNEPDADGRANPCVRLRATGRLSSNAVPVVAGAEYGFRIAFRTDTNSAAAGAAGAEPMEWIVELHGIGAAESVIWRSPLDWASDGQWRAEQVVVRIGAEVRAIRVQIVCVRGTVFVDDIYMCLQREASEAQTPGK